MWTVVVTDQQGKEIARHEWQQGSLTIGRDQGRNIVLPSQTASRKHARLDLLGGTPVVVDEGSANGTLVNGAKIMGPTRVDEHAKIDVCEFRITLQRAAAAEDDSEKTVLMKPKAFSVPTPPPPPPQQAAPSPQQAVPPMAPRPTPPGATPPPMARPMPPGATPPPVVRPMGAMPAAPRPAAPSPPPPAAPTLMPPPPPPPPKPAAPASEWGVPAFPDAPKPGAGGYGDSDITSQFERQLASVRSYREESQAVTLNKKARVDQDWGKVVQSLRSLQTRLSADKRVLAFTISRDMREVAIKIADPGEKRGHRYFLLSRSHPDGKFPGVESVWLREFGRDDASFDDAQKGMEELMMRVAGTLA